MEFGTIKVLRRLQIYHDIINIINIETMGKDRTDLTRGKLFGRCEDLKVEYEDFQNSGLLIFSHEFPRYFSVGQGT